MKLYGGNLIAPQSLVGGNLSCSSQLFGGSIERLLAYNGEVDGSPEVENYGLITCDGVVLTVS